MNGEHLSFGGVPKILFFSIQYYIGSRVLLVNNTHKVNGALWINNSFTSVSESNRMLSTHMDVDNQKRRTLSHNTIKMKL